MAKVWVCTYASEEGRGNAELLRHTALREGEADRVVVYGPGDRPDGLYWDGAWRAWCVAQTLRRSDRGDVVVWCDPDAMFEASLKPYAQADWPHVLLFVTGKRIQTWTKRDTFAFMDRTEDRHRHGALLAACVQMYRNTPEAHAFVMDLLRWCSDTRVVDDAKVLQDYPGTRGHLRDQSALSLLAVDHPAVRTANDPVQQDGPVGDGQEDDNTSPTDLELPPDLVFHHRKVRSPARVAVVTPTVGSPHLEACVRSVQDQLLPNVVHYLVVDGPEHEAAVRDVVRMFEHRKPVHVAVLPHNVGADGWCGHRVYGALPWLVDAAYVSFLDEDNMMEPGHLRDLLKAVVATRSRWGFSLRKIVLPDGTPLCADNCESLGSIHHTVCGRGDRLVDTNCYLMERALAIETSPKWNARFRDPATPEADRGVCAALLGVRHACSRRHSLVYRTGSTSLSVPPRFFTEGNRRFGYDFAEFQDLYVFHFSPEATARFLRTRREMDRSYALDEWQMTLLRGLDGRPGSDRTKRFNLLDGYACAEHIPTGACVYVSMCFADQVPWALLHSRRGDVWRIGYTAESPNIRHKDQWDPELLGAHFDVVLTYWKPLLEDQRVNALFCPHNAHHLDFGNPMDLRVLRDNLCSGKSCAMVLERRGLSGRYRVPNVDVTLECLDSLRELVVKDLADVTAFGVGWDECPHPGVKIGHALHRTQDPRHAVDILQEFSFAVIVENCDAEGYASEKLYDALIAGAVPLYYGSPPRRLGIPEGKEGVYLDLRKLFADRPREEWSSLLQGYLDSLTDRDVRAWKERVVAHRRGILEKVGVEAFADAVRAAMHRRKV